RIPDSSAQVTPQKSCTLHTRNKVLEKVTSLRSRPGKNFHLNRDQDQKEVSLQVGLGASSVSELTPQPWEVLPV
ncbi:mCG132114, isoform CRA_c, partial [Mus musculus]